MADKSIYIAVGFFLIGNVVSLETVADAGDSYHSPESLLGNRIGSLRNIAEGKYTPPEEMDSSFWINRAQASVVEKANNIPNKNRAKNIIMFLGDGMSIPTLTASRIYKGQLQGKTGEEETLTFENFPFSGLSKTYCANGQVPDSACTATAYLCGVKANMLTIGVNAHVEYNNCSASSDTANQVESIAKWAQEAGKATGIVTTTTVTNASPAGSYAHVANRQWECDNDIITYGGDPTNCADIATQLITKDPGTNFNVILGGGRGKMIPETSRDISGKYGERKDGKNLIRQWQANHPWGVYVNNRDSLLTTDYSQTDHLLGLFQYGYLEFKLESDETAQPTLAEMTEAAIRVVERNENGFFLFIEGGRIDHGHHFTQTEQALSETLEFEQAIAKALEITNDNETLIVITSDHAHTMSFAGYPGRGNDIVNLNEYDVDAFGVKYSTLSYAVGPNQYLDANGNNMDLTGMFNKNFVFPSYIKADMGTHAGDDVGIFANGPYSHLFSGVMEQCLIPHLMAYASCIGKGRTVCNPVLCYKK